MLGWSRHLVSAVLAICLHVSAAAAQPKTHEEQMAVLKALLQRTQLIPKIDQLSFDGRYSEALPLAEQLLALTTPALGATEADSAWALERLARVHEGLGRWPDAEAATREALRVRESLGAASDAMAAENRNRLAVYYEAQGRAKEAEHLYEAASRGGPGARLEAVAGRLNYLSVIRDAQGRFGDAELLAKRALVLRQQALGPEHADVALTMNNLAMIYWAQGRRAEVEPLLSRAISILEKQHGPEHPEVGRLVGNLASVIDDPKRDAQAEALLQRAIAIDQKAYGPEHRSVLVGLNNLAAFYRDRRRLDEADAVQTRALALIEASLARYKDNELVRSFLELPTYHARMLTNHAGIRFAQGRHDDALAMLERALVLEEQNRGPEHPAVAHVVTRMAAIHAVKDRWAAAHDAYARAADIHMRRLRAARSTDRQGPQAARDGEGSREAFLGLALAAVRLAEQDPRRRQALTDEAFRAAQWAERSSAGAALARMSARFASGSDALAAMARERQDLTEESSLTDRQLSAVLAEPPAAQTLARAKALRERIAALDGKLAAMDQRLGRDFPAYFALVNPEPAGIGETQQLLGASEVLIQYAIGPKESIAWLVSRAETRAIRVPLGETALAEHVEALRCGLDQALWEEAGSEQRCVGHVGVGKIPGGLPFPLWRAGDLYAALLQPFERAFQGKQLLIVPVGPLTSLPFGVLLTAPPPARMATDALDYRRAAWLGARQAITVLPSVAALRALRAVQRGGPAQKRLAGFANPLLGGNPDSPAEVERARLARERQRCPPPATRLAGGTRPLRASAQLARNGRADPAGLRGLVALPETADELCAVAASVGAPESDLRLGARATESEVKRMSRADELMQFRVLHFATHAAVTGEIGGASEPGLILTPPETPTDADDGYLSASEIAQLKLNAEWVVLSACNTAAGNTANAEALSGLARAFFYAGARALLVSHWAVDSDATVRLITKAFAEMTPGQVAGVPITRAEAMRRSIAAMISDGRAVEAHPAFWAPFVVVGEGGTGG
jgi:CHAT domain-containing protein/tetratricopeptide (TPR) repeat protein